MEETFDIGVLGWWYGENYGSMLTYYALNRILKKLGYSVLMIHEAFGYNGWRVHWDKNIAPLEFARRVGYDYTEQVHFGELVKLNEKCRAFIVGSDQLWNSLIGRVNDDLFLNFTEDDKKRIAYATSFGNSDNKKFNPDFLCKNIPNLKRFDSISVCEKYAVNTAKNIFGVDAKQVLDPVFLLNQKEYSRLAAEATTRPKGDYLLSFVLDLTSEKKAIIINIAQKLKLNKIVILTEASTKNIDAAQSLFFEGMFQFISEVKPENWLYAYEKSKYVITDNLYGSCFSIIFQKPFSVFFNKIGSERVISLMKFFEFGDERRIFEYLKKDVEKNKKISYEIDYSACNSKIATESKKSYEWLKNAIDAPKKRDKILPAGNRFPKLRWFLLQNRFDFYEENEADPLNENVEFRDNGTIENAPRGIKFWAIEGGRLAFYDKNQKLVSTFKTREFIENISNDIQILEEAVDH